MAVSFSKTCQFISLCVLGVISVISVFILLFVFPAVLDRLVEKRVAIEPSVSDYDKWIEPTDISYQQFWVFNVENPEDIVRHGARPILTEIGPFTYRLKKIRQNVTWNDRDGTVAYSLHKSLHFDRRKSIRSDDNIVTVPNIPLLISAIQSKRRGFFYSMGVNLLTAFYNEPAFIRVSVKDLLFSGYTDHAMQTIEQLTGFNHLQNGRFAVLNERNNSIDPAVVIHTGQEEPTKKGVILSFNNSRSVSYWNDKFCNMVNGSDSFQFPTNLEKNGSDLL